MFGDLNNYGPGLNTRGFAIVRDNSAETPIEFWMNEEENKKASAEKGYTVTKQIPFIRFHMGNNNTFDRAVREEDKHKYARQWAAFQANAEQIPDGLPISIWPGISKDEAAKLRHCKIFTVEQLANAPDTHIQDYGMGGMALKQKAKKWVESQASAAPVLQLQSENETLKIELDRLKNQLNEFMALMEEKATKKKGS